jgi:hypothetical protein
LLRPLQDSRGPACRPVLARALSCHPERGRLSADEGPAVRFGISDVSRKLSSELLVWYYPHGRHANGENIETNGFATRYGNFHRRLLTLLEGYIDESGSAESHLFTLSCVVSHGGQWWHFENAWVNWLDKKNQELKKQGRKELSRYKASDCSCFHNEFEDWDKDEQIAFLEGLLNVFRRHTTAIISYTVDLKHIAEEMPGTKEKAQAVAYILLLHNIMVWIGERLLEDKRYAAERISLIHDRTSRHDSVLLDAFNAMKDDESFKHRNRFTTIAPMGWEDCILLQPADLIAYENFKIIERTHAGQKKRRIMELLLDLSSVGGRGVELTRQGIKEINEKQTDESRRALYENARICQPKK